MAENEAFSQVLCADHNIAFIGATPSNISRMGDKNTARDTMKAAGVPIVPGSDGLIESEDHLRQVANDIGYPIIIKATAGGGGKGMRVVEEESELINAYQMASNEASAAFGNGAVYVEKFVKNPRHIEIQVLSDPNGNAVHLFERDCSIQRRHQNWSKKAHHHLLVMMCVRPWLTLPLKLQNRLITAALVRSNLLWMTNKTFTLWK